MGLFDKLFKKEKQESIVSAPKGFYELEVSSVIKLTTDSVKVTFKITDDLKSNFKFEAGQYVDICPIINGIEERRSYSICSGENEPLSIGVKQVEGGVVSTWVLTRLNAGDKLFVSSPKGTFTLPIEANKVVAITAGSGITPVLSIAKKINGTDKSLQLFYSNKTEASIMFKDELDQLTTVDKKYYLTQEVKDGFGQGRLEKDKVISIIKENLDILKSDAFFLCGPEELIFGAIDALTLFGVPKAKIHFELFQTPVTTGTEPKSTESTDFSGFSKVTVILDDEKVSFELDAKGKTILDAANAAGMDAPYSCRGGVCSTCRCKVIKGKASMNINFSLTDNEVEKGYILACQAHPDSEELLVSFDE